MLFIPYSLFGWGIPFGCLVAASVAQFQSTRLGIPSTINPNIGVIRCWFPGNYFSPIIIKNMAYLFSFPNFSLDGASPLIFFYIPASLLMFFNIFVFLSLVFNANLMNCWKGKRTMSMRTNKTTANSKGMQE